MAQLHLWDGRADPMNGHATVRNRPPHDCAVRHRERGPDRSALEDRSRARRDRHHRARAQPRLRVRNHPRLRARCWRSSRCSCSARFSSSSTRSRLASGSPRSLPALVAGGTIGNTLDRIRIGSVRDFIVLPGAIINLADVAVAAGVVGLAIALASRCRECGVQHRHEPERSPAARSGRRPTVVVAIRCSTSRSRAEVAPACREPARRSATMHTPHGIRSVCICSAANERFT